LPKLVLLCALMAGCSSKHPNAPLESATPTETLPVQEAAVEKPAFSAVTDSLKAGALDDAAARLFNMRASGREFSQSEAVEFRKALDEVYTRALEAAEKGDPRAEAALEIIRAAAAR
jgi:hypothetical protein